MKLWFLKRRHGLYMSHGEVRSAVIAAETEEMARSLCGNIYLKEDYHVWNDPEQSSCTELVIGDVRDVLIVDDTVGDDE